ncbi:hypothetical protein AWB74_08350 [Caballeronia arvi]|uniref:Uncharacterized protein n=1 Tax=Caballeronia arvi TaxID=1777135 RepID=A0A158L4R4_9BURK|nr:hypothetical protein AWB74_08350 [Caballeronia arvi]
MFRKVHQQSKRLGAERYRPPIDAQFAPTGVDLESRITQYADRRRPVDGRHRWHVRGNLGIHFSSSHDPAPRWLLCAFKY